MKERIPDNSKIIIRVSIITIIVNLVLFVLKLVLGILEDNLSVISDAIHSGSDLFTSFLIIGAVFLASPKRDKKHNYGREKVESLVVLFLAIIIGGVGVFLGYEGVRGIISPTPAALNWYLIVTVILSIIVKEWMFHYEMRWAKRINSALLKADAWHSRSDSLSSIAVLIGLVLSTFIKTNLAESIAVIIVALFIVKVAFSIAIPAVNQLVDKSAGEEVDKKIREIALQTDGVVSVDKLFTRMFGSKIYVDIEIAVDGNLTVHESHGIAHALHDYLEGMQELRIKHCHVHVNPAKCKASPVLEKR